MSMIERIEGVISELKRLQQVLEDELPALDIEWLRKVMSRLRHEHPVFHSEADFKEQLHSQLSTEGLDAHIEHPFNPHKIDKSSVRRKPSGARNALDIWLPDKGVAIELKYPKKALKGTWKNEKFALSEGGAADQARYDFLKDIERLENLNLPGYRVGFAVLLTNESLLWRKRPSRNETFDEQFRIHDEERVSPIKGCLQWQSKIVNGQEIKPSEGTMSGDRDKPICLRDSYWPKWCDYCVDISKVEGVENVGGTATKFRYLAFKVKPQRKG